MPWKVPLFSETGELEWFEASDARPPKLGVTSAVGPERDTPGYADGYPVVDLERVRERLPE